MQHLINASDQLIELENGQIVYPGQTYVRPVDEDDSSNDFDELMRLKKEELQAKAETLGLEVKSTDKKEDIANAILEKGAEA